MTRLFYPHIGGVEKHVHELGNRLISQGHTVTIVTEQYERKLKKKEMIGKIQVYRIPVSSIESEKKWIIWKWLFQNKRLIENSDIIHCHDVFFWYMPFRFLYFQKPVFTTFHGYETTFPPSKKAVFIRKLSEILSKRALIVGEYIKKWYGTNTNFIIYGGINKKNIIHKNVKKNNKTVKIVFLGRLENDTGVLIYLQVLEKLKEKKFNFEFIAAGDGTLREKVATYGKVLGSISTIEKYIQSADIIFASSYLSILECLSYEKYIIAVYNNELKKDYLISTPFAKWISIQNKPEKIVNLILKHKEMMKNLHIRESKKWLEKQTWDDITSVYKKMWNI